MKKFAVISFVAFAVTTSLFARDEDPTVLYQPSLKLIEGDQPLFTSYVLSVKSPTNVPIGANLAITPVVGVVSAPAGVSAATALSFISLSAPSLTFTGPEQSRTVTVTANVPEGTVAGEYVWSIATNGWLPGTIDPKAFINAKVTVPAVPFPPTVNLSLPLDGSVHAYLLGGAPTSIALAFTATAPAISPITSIDADVNGTAVALTSTGLTTDAVQANGTIQLSQPGVYTVRARATNAAGTSSDTVEITVNLQVPPPVVTILQPVTNTFVYHGGTLAIPFSFTSSSLLGGTTALSATLNGAPVAITSLGLGSLLATGSGSLAIDGAGTYTLAVTGTTANGTTSVSKTLYVASANSTNPPVVAISQPLAGATFTRVAGSPPTNIPFAFAAVADIGQTITTLSGSLNGSPVTISASGLGSGSATGTGNFSVTTPGTYTFVAGATSGTLGGSQSVSFTVTETPAPGPDCTVFWLPPISLGKVQKGGSELPIKFTLDCGCDSRKRDTSVVIFIYEIFPNGSTGEPAVFTYARHGKKSRRDDTYEIDGNHYQLNFAAARGTHRYHIDVYRAVEGSTTPELIGTKEFTTK